MLKKILKIGDRIELKSIQQSKLAGKDPKTYQSQILDIMDEYRMNIAVPLESGHLVALEVGTRYELSFLTVSGRYVCKCEIKNRLKQNNIYYLVVDIISELKKDQRRQYFRLEKIVPLKYRVISELEMRLRYFMEKKAYKDEREKRLVTEKLEQLEREVLEGTIINVSGGGIKFSSLEKHENGNLLLIKFSLDDEIMVEAEARIIASNEVMNQRGVREYRCEFKRIKKEIRENIVRYIFSEERKQRQKESGY